MPGELAPDEAVQGKIADSDAALLNKFAYHYAQSEVWRNEADTRRKSGDTSGHAYAEQHALGHALHVEHIRGRMPSELRIKAQSGANRHARDPKFLDHLPAAWRAPQPSEKAPINNGSLTWTPPESD